MAAENLYSPTSNVFDGTERMVREERHSIVMEKDLRRQLGVKKSLQALEEISSPGLYGVSPLLQKAGTPAPYLATPPAFASLNKTDRSHLFDKDADSPATEVYSPSLNGLMGTPNRYSGSFLLQQSFADTPINTPGKPEDVSSHAILLEKDPAMEGAGDLFEEFMNLYEKHTSSSDIFELVEEYETLCRDKIKSLLGYINKMDPSRRRMKKTVNLLNQLYRECYTWRLLGSLFRDRIVTESVGIDDTDSQMLPPVDSAKSERIIVDQLFEFEPAIRQCQIIIDWLEKNMQDKLEDLLSSENAHFHSNSMYWEHTVHDLHQIQIRSKDPSLATNLVTEIDPDAPIRQQRSLSALDQQDEEQLLMYMFRFIRAGKVEEAQNLCSEQGHFWRAATLNGWQLWHDPNYYNENDSEEILPAVGNPDRDLWKINCWSLSQEKGCSVYEKAMYGSLSGNLKQLLPACNSWEDCLWAYFKVLIDLRVEEEIRNKPRSKTDFLDLPKEYWEQAQENELNPKGIIDHLRRHPNTTIKKQSEDVYRVFQSNIILNEIDDLLMKMKSVIETSATDPHLLRCMVHFVLFLQTVGIQTKEEVCVEVLHKYVEVLIERKKFKLVATYTSCLPVNMQVDVYARFLQGITEEDDREMYLQMGEQAGLDLKKITKRIVENIRAKDYDSDDVNSTEFDELKINAIKWLLYDPSQRAEAMKQANAITRVFLAAKKHVPAQAVFDKLPSDSIDVVHKQWRGRAGEKVLPAEDDDAIREYFSIKAYLIAHDAFNAWFSHYHQQAPTEPTAPSDGTFKAQILYEESMKEYQTQFERWQKTLESHVKTTSDCIYNVFTFPGGWLVDQRRHTNEVDSHRSQQLKLLRHLCIPYLAFLLHNVLHSSKHYRSVLQLAEVIQSKQYKLYEVFQKQELQKCLSLIRDSCIALLDEGCDPFGYERTNLANLEGLTK